MTSQASLLPLKLNSIMIANWTCQKDRALEFWRRAFLKTTELFHLRGFISENGWQSCIRLGESKKGTEQESYGIGLACNAVLYGLLEAVCVAL